MTRAKAVKTCVIIAYKLGSIQCTPHRGCSYRKFTDKTLLETIFNALACLSVPSPGNLSPPFIGVKIAIPCLGTDADPR